MQQFPTLTEKKYLDGEKVIVDELATLAFETTSLEAEFGSPDTANMRGYGPEMAYNPMQNWNQG